MQPREIVRLESLLLQQRDSQRVTDRERDSRARRWSEVENTRLPEPLAARLKSDVERWARDEPGCGEGPVTAGWNADSAPVPAGKTPAAKTKKP